MQYDLRLCLRLKSTIDGSVENRICYAGFHKHVTMHYMVSFLEINIKKILIKVETTELPNRKLY